MCVGLGATAVGAESEKSVAKNNSCLCFLLLGKVEFCSLKIPHFSQKSASEVP
jgi:hypothetical protein